MVEKMDDSVRVPVAEVVYQLRRVGPPSTIQNSASLIRLQDDGEVTIGRGPAADYFVDSAIMLRLISRIHATVRGERLPSGHPRFTIISSGLNGTYINECKMGSFPNNKQVLLEGDKITFGHPGCSSIQPGEFAPQLESEFQFIFECVPASRLPQTDRHRNHSRTLPLSGNPGHTHLQKHSPIFKSCSTVVPRLTDSPLSTASTSEKENDITISVCQDVKNILSNGVDSKPIKIVKYSQNTKNVLSLENNKKPSGVGCSGLQTVPVLPSQTDVANPKLCFYNSSGDLTFCDPNNFLNYTEIVKSLKSLSSQKGSLSVEDSGCATLPSTYALSDTKPDFPSFSEADPAADLLGSCDELHEDVITGFEVNSTTIILSDEIDEDDDDDVVEDDDDDNLIAEDNNDDVVADDIVDDVVAEDNVDDAVGEDNVDDEDAVDVADEDVGRASDGECGGSSVQVLADSGPDVVIIDETGQSGDAANSKEEEEVNIISCAFPESAEVNFGFEDIVEVTVTTEKEDGALDSVNEDCNVGDRMDSDVEDDSDSSMPSLKCSLQLRDSDAQDSEDGMPLLVLMNDTRVRGSEMDKTITELSYKGDISAASALSHAKEREATPEITNKAPNSRSGQASSLRQSSNSANSQLLSSVTGNLINSQSKQENGKATSVICTCGHSENSRKSKSSKSHKMKPQTEVKCPKHGISSKSSQVHCESSRHRSSQFCDRKSHSANKSKSGKSKTVVEDVQGSPHVLSCKKSAKSQKKHKENRDTGGISSDFDKERRKNPVLMTDLAAFRDAALKLKSVCGEVVSLSSKSPSSLSSQSKSPPSCLLQSMTPSSKSPLSDLYQGESPLYLHTSKSPPYTLTVKSSQDAKPKSPNVLPSKDQSFKSHTSAASLSRASAPVTNTTTIILSSGNEHKAKSSRSHEKSKSRKRKDNLLKQSSVSSSSTRPSSSLSSHSSEASASHSRSSSSGTSKSTSSSDVSSLKSRSSSGDSLADSRSSASSSHTRHLSGSLPRSRSSSQSSSESGPPSRSSSQNSRHSSGSPNRTFFKDTVPNLYSSSDEDGTVQESKTEIVKKIYSPKGKQDDAAGKGNMPRRSSSLKTHKQSSPSLTTMSSKQPAAATPKQVSPQVEPKKSQLSSQLEPKKSQLSSQVVPKKSQLSPHVEPKKSQLSPQVEPKKSQLSPHVEPKKSQLSPQVEPKKSQLSPQVVPKKSQLSSQLEPKKSQLSPQVEPKKSQLSPQVVPKKSQLSPQVEPKKSQLSPHVEPKKSQSRAVRDLSPASSASSDISDLTTMSKKPKTEGKGSKPEKNEKKPEGKPAELPQAAARPKPLALPQNVPQLNNIKPRPAVTKEALPSSPSLALTSLPWMTSTSGPTDSYKKSNTKKMTTSKPGVNQTNSSPAVAANHKSATPVSQINEHNTSMKGASAPKLPSTVVPRTSKVLLSASSFQVKTDDQKPLSNCSSQPQPKAISGKHKVDSSTKATFLKADSSSSSLAKDTDVTPVSGKTNNSRITSDAKGSRNHEKKPNDAKVDSVGNRGKRTRVHQSSSRLNKDSESSDSDDEPVSKKRDLRTDAARASTQQSMSLRTPRSVRSDKPETQTSATRKRKLSQMDSLTSKTPTAKGKKSTKATGAKRGRPPKNKGKKKRIADSSSEDEADNKYDEDDVDDDLLDSDSDDSESWELPDGVQYYDNECSAKKCLNPEGKQVDWVMCDHCEQWYHVVCVNCPMDVVLNDDAQFHCGC